MDSGTTPLQSPGFLGALTTAHFVLIALLAVLTIIGIAYGMKQSRHRRQGVRELERAGHLDRSGEAPTPDPDAPGEAATARAPVATEQAAGGGDRAETVQAPVADAPVAAPVPGDTDLTRLKGLGPKVAAMLVDQGIPDIATLARLDPAQADAVAARLGIFAPRMARDRWIEQAQLLAAGDIAGFEAKFGKL